MRAAAQSINSVFKKNFLKNQIILDIFVLKYFFLNLKYNNTESFPNSRLSVFTNKAYPYWDGALMCKKNDEKNDVHQYKFIFF